jgi:hypothetical protein
LKTFSYLQPVHLIAHAACDVLLCRTCNVFIFVFGVPEYRSKPSFEPESVSRIISMKVGLMPWQL